ncbi:zinc finger, RING-type, Zinc finger, C2H2-like protein [Artemisia annua]|uniref:RING-type E3 ubiquitin transferase n=1 Tax=Artemisia annua TaxID=35608 RepID=A0A2U1LVW9_ARTAN|nr:zinc finger, RING-type, Zinc finger, C2H2-like protein [Artemisia annua]
MDDSCAVCAESLEWVAYGSCGHKDVCSTCVARLRFICNDRRCCICKTESPIIFVTKALGDYTKNINDFTVFPAEDKEGRSGQYWYHEDTQSYFDDLEQYKMIKAMCRLSCSVCDKVEENAGNASKRKARFRDINQLKGHLFHQHKVFMCSLCLEGRKVFICEQKLYNKAQLKQHINTGDSEVDGSESDRGGFQGHPLCEFCRTPFYGDNELYTHMSTEHFTCHICKRQNPGQFEYYKNYDDLEIHFRQEHFLCEDEACLTKKFVVFTSEGEMKKHNALEHGGRMSRSKRNAILQLPTSFTYRRSNEQDRRGRRRTFQRDMDEDELSQAIEASFETANFPEASSSSTPDHYSTNGFEPLLQSSEAIGTETDPRYLMAASHRTRNAPLEESSFPPLSTGPSGSAPRPIWNTMADNLRRQSKKKINVLNTGQAWPGAPVPRFNNHQPSSSSVSRHANTASSVVSGQRKPTSSPIQAQPQPRVQIQAQAQPQPRVQIQAQPQPRVQIQAQPSVGSSTSTAWKTTSKMSHSSSAPNLVDTGSASDFPPVSALQTQNVPPANGPSTKKVEEVYAANKKVVEKIKEGLNHDEDKYASFRNVSAEFRQGLIDAETYLVYVNDFGLSHLVLDLAKLCPDPDKKQELIAVYNANRTISGSEGKNQKRKGKGVAVDNNNSTNNLTDNILSSLRELQMNYRPPEEEVEILSKDGYRVINKGKSKVDVDDRSSPGGQLGGGGSGDSEGKSKQKSKKTSKFLRTRLGNGSMASILDVNNSNGGSDDSASNGNKEEEATDGVPVRGVWRNGGGIKLIVKDKKRT